MSGNKKPLICIDTSVYLGWYKKEPSRPLIDIEHILEQVRDNKVNLLIPAICYVEVINYAGSTDGDDFRAFAKRSNVISVDIDRRVADLAASMRTELSNMRPRRNLKTPDTLIVASALHYKADVLYAFDDRMQNVGLLSMTGSLKVMCPSKVNIMPLFSNKPYLPK